MRAINAAMTRHHLPKWQSRGHRYRKINVLATISYTDSDVPFGTTQETENLLFSWLLRNIQLQAKGKLIFTWQIRHWLCSFTDFQSSKSGGIACTIRMIMFIEFQSVWYAAGTFWNGIFHPFILLPCHHISPINQIVSLTHIFPEHLLESN